MGSNAKVLGLADLARSGLTADDARALKLEFWDAKKTAEKFPHAGGSCSIMIPYFTPSGKPQGNIYRVRFLEAPKGPFGESPEKWQRYGQEKGSEPGVYFPTNQKDWPAVLADPLARLILTEGEKKAAKACKEGFPTIGLGGVWSFMSKARGYELLPALESIVWRGRAVYICYDSDVAQKSDVAKATMKLIDVLTERGAIMHTAPIPEIGPGKKAGLDDYLIEVGKEKFEQFLTLAQGRDLAKALWRFNEKFSMILNPTTVLVEPDASAEKGSRPVLLDPTKFERTTYANVRSVEVDTQGENARIKAVSVAQRWLEWPARRQFSSMTYAPGQPAHIEVGNKYNLWRGFATTPKRGGVGPWKELLDHLFTDTDPEARKWFERWCGYPIKFPGTKLLTACGVWSSKTGQGKTLVGDTLGRIYGPNFVSIPQHDLESDFNDALVWRQFVLVDDISPHDTRQRADLFKKLITQNTLLVNTKFVPKFEVPDFVNYYLTSNHPNSLFIDEDDRRLFVHEVKVGKLPVTFYDKYFKWLEEDGPAALHYYFNETLDYGDFHPKCPPPMTAAKMEMIGDSRGEVDDFLHSIDSVEALKVKDVWSISELAGIFNATAVGRRIPVNAFGMRVKRIFGPDMLNTRIGAATHRLVAVRNQAKWRQKGASDWAAEYLCSKKPSKM